MRHKAFALVGDGHGFDITCREREDTQRLKCVCGRHRNYHRLFIKPNIHRVKISGGTVRIFISTPRSG